MAPARKNQVVTHEMKWYKSLKENFLGKNSDIISSCRGQFGFVFGNNLLPAEADNKVAIT